MGAGTASATFAGRERELDRVVSILAGLDDDGATTLLVSGEAGIGKTRLVDELCDRARAGGALVGVGVCTPAEGGGLPYGPVVGVLRDLARQLDERQAELVLGGVRRALGLDAAPVDDGPRMPPTELAKTRLFEALLDACIRLGERARVVLVLEDLQWADTASAEVLEFLTRNLDAQPVLLIGTLRDDELAPTHRLGRITAELARHRRVTRIELAGLDRDAIGVLMGDIIGRPPDWTQLDAVHTRSGGNPFFVEELTAARNTPSLPSTLRNVVMLRIDSLSDPARLLVVVTAVAGGSADHRLLAAGAALDDADLDRGLAEAVACGVLATATDGRYQFRHGLQREAIDDAITPAQGARVHRRLARALADHPELGADGPGHALVELAGHWWGASAWDETLPSALAAGDAMTRLFAMPAAHAQYEHGLEAWERLDAEAAGAVVDHVDLLLKAADAAYLAEGALERAVELAARALDEINAQEDPLRAAAALKILGRNAWAVGRADDAFDAFRRAIELLTPGPPSAELAGAIAEEARCLMLSARDHEGARRALEAIDVALATGAEVEEAQARCTLGCCLANDGAVEEGLAELQQALAMARRLGHPDLLNRSYANLTHALITAARLEDAAAVVLADEAGAMEPMIRLGAAGTNGAEALIMLGRYDDAEDLVCRLEELGTGSCVFGPHGVRALLDLRRGRLDSAAEYVDRAQAVSAGNDTVQVLGSLYLLRAEIALERGEPETASAEIDNALALAAGTDDHWYHLEMCALGTRALADQLELGRSRGRTIDTDKLRGLATGLVDEAARHVAALGGPDTASPRPCAYLATARAEASRLDASDPDLWTAAANAWGEAHEPLGVAYCTFRAGEAELTTRPRQGEGPDAVREAWRIASGLTGTPLLADIERLAVRARIDLAAVAATPPSHREQVAEDLGLTPREVEVLDQLARGRTDKQVAEHLFISKKTVSVHVSSILRKLDASNRVDAGEIGQHAGLGIEGT